MRETEAETLTVRLGELDNHGTTRARVGGKWVEVEHGIPGEVASIEIMGQRRQRGRIVDLLEPASDRVFPPCEYFREWACGGCQWQHISYRSQVRRKRRAIESAMQRAGLDIPVTATYALDEPWRYRSTAGIALGKSAGFRRHGSLAIVPIQDCPISHPTIGALMARLNDLIDAGKLPDFRGRVRLDVRLADGPALQILVRPDEDRPPEAKDIDVLTTALIAMDGVLGVSLARTEGAPTIISGSAFARATVAGRPVFLHAGSFFQTNLELLPQLINRLRVEAAPLEAKRVADVYGGVGVLGLFLGADGAQVTVIESDPMAEEACRLTAQEWGLESVRFQLAEAESGLRDAGAYDVIILDPPRTGLGEGVIDALVEGRPGKILYVSCLAQSLARDLGILIAGGYSIDHLELFDFYPQTYHVEILAVLRAPETSQ